MSIRAIIISMLLAGVAGGAGAQQPTRRGAVPGDSVALELPEGVADAAVRFFNDPATLRFFGAHTVEARDTVRADVAALGGPLVVRGRIEGSVLMLNGDVRLLPGASVGGGLTVVGGSLEGEASAAVGGEIVAYGEKLRYHREGSRIALAGAEEGYAGRGRSDFLVATGKSYNRVEGLPITFGPRVRTGSLNPLQADALAIYRTESGATLDPDEMGYYARVEQFVGGHLALRVGATAHSLDDPIEDWQISDLESGLSTFLFHRDFRDHYRRRGVSLFSFWSPRGSPLELGAEARWETHRSIAAQTPWSLTDNAEPWRPQPLVGEGTLNTLSALATFDSRSSPEDPATGWYVRGRLEQAFRSTLERPGAFLSDPASGSASIPAELAPMGFGLFTTGAVDIRRYNRVDAGSRLNFRLMAAAPLGGKGLPPQRQHALGGEGSLPGYPLFGLDCGARASEVYLGGGSLPSTAFFPRYGCDAYALAQAEYRGKFSFRFLWDSVPWRHDVEDDEDWGFVVDFSPDWTFFIDAGRGWGYGSGTTLSTSTPLAADVGLGILLNRFGLFVAVPLTGSEGVNLFARIGPRF